MVWQREDKYAYEKFLKRHKIILVFFVFLFAVLSIRLFFLQVVKGNHYRNISEQQRMHNTYERAPRGTIYDANGNVLVGSDFTYVALFYPFEQQKMPTDETIEEINKILGRDIKPSIDRSWRNGRVVKLADNLTMDEMFKIQEKRLILNGIAVVKEPKRVYYNAEATSHITGYTSEIQSNELEDLLEEGYKIGSHIGRGGIEQIYDRFLQGVDGGWQFEVNAKGYQTKIFEYIPPKIGAGVYSTIDIEIQKVAYEALKNSSTGRGAAVVLDVRNGAVKALVSSPGFDTNTVGTKDFIKYLRDKKKLPLFNRALQAHYPPGSIFKIVTFVAATEILNVNPRTLINCTGSFELGDRFYSCSYKPGHGKVNLITAMAFSCNVCFYQYGLQLGVLNIEKFAKKFYLGQKTGIDLPHEKQGFVPNPEWKKSKMKMSWLQGDTVILAIGQGALTVTPVQMAAMISAVANKGIYYQPYIVEKVETLDGSVLYKHDLKTKDPIELSEKSWNLLHRALVDTVEYGTGVRCKLDGIKVAGKTGTAQNHQGEDHAWFVSFAPADNPEIALAIIVENGGGGGLNAVPIAREIYEEYFNIKTKTEEEQEEKK